MLNGLAFVHKWLYQRVAEYAVPDWGRRETHNPLPEALHLDTVLEFRLLRPLYIFCTSNG